MLVGDTVGVGVSVTVAVAVLVDVGLAVCVPVAVGVTLVAVEVAVAVGGGCDWVASPLLGAASSVTSGVEVVHPLVISIASARRNPVTPTVNLRGLL